MIFSFDHMTGENRELECRILSRVEGKISRVEGRGSRVECRGSSVEGRVSRVEGFKKVNILS